MVQTKEQMVQVTDSFYAASFPVEKKFVIESSF